MSKRQQLIDRIADLQRARKEAFSAGEWERVDLLGLIIDDTRAELASLPKL
jgi:hypothetical protein